MSSSLLNVITALLDLPGVLSSQQASRDASLSLLFKFWLVTVLFRGPLDDFFGVHLMREDCDEVLFSRTCVLPI